jgi:hypothetical protein
MPKLKGTDVVRGVVRGFSLVPNLVPRRTMTKVKEAISKEKTKEGLPKEAFAIVGDPQDPETWKLPHHTKAILRARGRLDIEKTVDWERMPAAVAALSRGGYRGERVQASEEEIIKAARHLANHYEAAGKPVPDTLGALI